MEAKELRIGNYVNCEFHNNDSPNPIKFWRPIIVDEIHEGVIISNRQRIDYKHLRSIPLTEEWLVRFGFKRSILGYELTTNFFSITFDNGEMSMCYGEYVESANPINCKYVHQLQNLYFALSGEELVIK